MYMKKLKSFDELLHADDFLAALILNVCEISLSEGEAIIEKNWEFEDLGSLEKNQGAYREAIFSLNDCFAPLYQAECAFEAEVQTFKFLAHVKNHIVKDFYKRPGNPDAVGPPTSNLDHCLDEQSADSVIRAIECSFAFQSRSAKKFAGPILKIIESSDYQKFDDLMQNFAENLRWRFTDYAKVFLRKTGHSYKDVSARLEIGPEDQIRSRPITTPRRRGGSDPDPF